MSYRMVEETTRARVNHSVWKCGRCGSLVVALAGSSPPEQCERAKCGGSVKKAKQP